MNENLKRMSVALIALFSAACSALPMGGDESPSGADESEVEGAATDVTGAESEDSASRPIGPIRGLASTGPIINSFTVDGYTPTSYYLDNPSTGTAIYTTVPLNAQVVLRWSYANAICSLGYSNHVLGQPATSTRLLTNLISASGVVSYTTAPINTEQTFVFSCAGKIDVGGYSVNQNTSRSVHFIPAAAPASCTYTYGAWSACVNGSQARAVASATPSGCVGTPVTSQACTAPVMVDLVANARASTRCARYSTFTMSWTSTPGATCKATTGNWSTANGSPQKVVFTGTTTTTYGISCSLNGATATDTVTVSPQ